MAKQTSRPSASRRKKKSFSSDVLRWFRSLNAVRAPLFPLFITFGVVLVCLYIAVMASLFHTDKPDANLLSSGISWDDIFTQKTMRSVRGKMGLAETDLIYLYSAPTAAVDSGGNVTEFSLPLIVPNKQQYSLWELSYRSEGSSLYLRQTAKNKKQKDLAVVLDQLPDADEVIKTFLVFPGKYLSRTFPLASGGTYRLEPASEFAVTNFDFASQLTAGTPGVWISGSGGGSIVDASFHPTGKYFTYRCTMSETHVDSSSSQGTSDEGGSAGMELQSKILIMTELSSGGGIL